MRSRRSFLRSFLLALPASALACHGEDLSGPTTGTIELTTSTTGLEADPDGYTVMLDSREPGQSIAASGSATLAGVPAGRHSVALTGVASNCSVADGASRDINVAVGGSAEVSFAVTCSANTGSLRLSVATTGASPDLDGYTVRVDGRTGQNVAPNGEVTIPNLAPGAHSVELSGIAANCEVEAGNLQTVTVTAGAISTAAFNVVCRIVQTSKLVFVSDRDDPNNTTNIYAMNADGSGVTRLTNDGTDMMSPSWSPDRSKIVFAWRDDIYVMNADGSGRRNLTNDAQSDRDPTWSPDGSKIAFVRYRGSPDGTDIFVMNADGSGMTRLTDDPGYNVTPDWSGVTNKIAFTRFHVGGGAVSGLGLYVMSADGTGQTRIAGDAGQPAWSPDGSRIAFVRAMVVADRSGTGLFVMNADGSGVTRLTNSIGGEESPAWSPDGEQIAFTTIQQGETEVYVMNLDGSGQTNLTNHPANDSEPSW